MVSPYEYALMSLQSYTDGGGTTSSGWSVLSTSGATSDAEGYYGVSYINHITKEVVITHRGTDQIFSDVFDDDLLQLSLGRRPDQYTSALNFILSVKASFTNNGEVYEGYNITHTGHSLGAVLAELSAADFKEKAVTFDSPGTKPIIYGMISSGEILVPSNLTTNEFISTLNVTSYNAAPNLINTTNEHVGKTIRIYSEYNPTAVGSATSPASYLSFTANQHSILNIFNQFNPETGQPEVHSLQQNWPFGFGADGGYESFFLSYAKNTYYWDMYFITSGLDEQAKNNYITTNLGGIFDSPLVGVNIIGDDGDNLIFGATNYKDNLEGGAGNDTLLGFGGDDTLIGGTGDDTFIDGTGNDILDGGSGVDTISYEHLNGDSNIKIIERQYMPSAPAVGADIIIDIEKIKGSAHSDVMEITVLEDLSALREVDTGAGSDMVAISNDGDNHNLVVRLGADNDTIISTPYDSTVYGGSGKDLFYLSASNFAYGTHYTINDPDADDRIALPHNGVNYEVGDNIIKSPVFSTLAWALPIFAGSDVFVSMRMDYDKVVFTYGDDRVIEVNNFRSGDFGINLGAPINDGVRNETVKGSLAADMIAGNGGNDNIHGYAGDDTIYGGGIILYSASPQAVNINLNTNINSGGDAANDNYAMIRQVA